MENRIDALIRKLGISAYRFASDTDIPMNTVYALKKDPSQYPSGKVVDRIITTYKVDLSDIIAYVPPEERSQPRELVNA